MASSNAPPWPPIQSQEYAAAESMLQHSRSARNNTQALNGYALPEPQNYAMDASQSQVQLNPLQNMPVQSYPQFRHPFQPTTGPDPMPVYNPSLDGTLPSPPNLQGQSDQQAREQYSGLSHGPVSAGSGNGHRSSLGNLDNGGEGPRNSSVDGSESTSPVSVRGQSGRHSDGAGTWTHRSSHDGLMSSEIKEEPEAKPAWSELKTKAGKERKRLPLACIACRRKKIRCSGEHPACRHCTRSRIPCVYKVTTRKAAPRTDYIAMLDKRLKRMEERVIKIIPKEELAEASAIPRANLKPSGPPYSGKKRGAEEAFGSQLDAWAESKANSTLKGRKPDESKINTEGAEHLPSKEIQEYLSEVFFDYLYGQSYHLMHKPSYIRRLRAGTLPPVLVLAVCAISARFATHPQIKSEPAYLRGESWAGPARDIVLKRYDEPNITILTVILLLGLHEFGTCQGGRSWMFAGMATRMAYALQLHREMDHDPLSRNNDKKNELSFTDREIRRRTMWACFIMDRFNSSGTERPMFADEDDIKVQLPIKESNFQSEIPGPTEDLNGNVPNPVTSDAGQSSDPKDNMGVATYMVRIVTLWGRVIKYLNMGGKQKDPYPLWDPKSQFADLRKQAEKFTTSLPPDLQNTPENLQIHAAENLSNQYIFMHVASNQVVLFLNRFAIPTTNGGRNPQEMPKDFLTEAALIAVNAANQISILLTDAFDHRVYAPFVGYCAFLSSTVHVWGIFSNNTSLKTTSRKHLAKNVNYLSKMKKHWGMFQFMADNLKDIYRQHADASVKGNGEKDAAIFEYGDCFQYGDWFTKYPHGVSQSDFSAIATKIKKEPNDDAALAQKSDLQSVDDFFRSLSPPGNKSSRKKATRKTTKIASQPPPQPPPADHLISPTHQQQTLLPMNLPPDTPQMSPSTFPPPQTQPLYPPTSYPLLPQLSTNQPPALLPQLDRHLVHNAYAGTDPSSASAFNALSADQNYSGSPVVDGASAGTLWSDGGNGIGMPQQEGMMGVGGNSMGDVNTTAWFMPFNLNPPGVEEGDFEGVGFPGG